MVKGMKSLERWAGDNKREQGQKSVKLVDVHSNPQIGHGTNLAKWKRTELPSTLSFNILMCTASICPGKSWAANNRNQRTKNIQQKWTKIQNGIYFSFNAEKWT